MKKQLIVTALVIMATVAVVVSSPRAMAIQVDNKVTICHRDSNVKQPWGPKSQEVAADSADGDTGNDNGKGDHSEHTGPIPATEAEAQALKDAKQDWGDIIPPHDNYAGLNWTALGEAIWKNNCQFTGFGGGSEPTPTPTTPQPVAQVSTLPFTEGNGQTNAFIALGSMAGIVGSAMYFLRKKFIK